MTSTHPQTFLRQLDALRKLTDTVAHDVNNLLSGIFGYSELLLIELTAEHLKSPVMEIKGAGKRISSLIQLLSAFGGRQTCHPEILDLDEVILSAREFLAHLLGKAVDLQLVRNPGLRRVRADPTKTKQALIILAIEATYLMPEGGKLTISTRNHSCTPASAAGNAIDPGDHVRIMAVASGRISRADVSHSLLNPPAPVTLDSETAFGGFPSLSELANQTNGYATLDSLTDQELCISIYLPAADGSPGL
jgi:two-component system, cell cycle sensor histidine kinase and response regulator CckA